MHHIIQPKVKKLVEDGYDTTQKDSLGNTPILCAAENGHLRVVLHLSEHSPWHTVNLAGKTFLSTIGDSPSPTMEHEIAAWVSIMAAVKKVGF